MKTSKPLAVLLLTAAAGTCAMLAFASRSRSAPERPLVQTSIPGEVCTLPDVPQRVRLFPGNYSTMVRSEDLFVQVKRGRAVVTDAALQAVASTLSLTLYPEGTAVKIRTTYATEKDNGVVRVLPEAELADGWYELSATLSKDGMVWDDDHATKTRFYVGSRPVLKQVAICDKGNRTVKVDLSLSEPIDADSDAVFDVADSNARSVGCRPVKKTSGKQSAPQVPAPGEQGSTVPQPAGGISFECPDSILGQDLVIARSSGQLKGKGRALKLSKVDVPKARVRQAGLKCSVLEFDEPQELVGN